MDLSSLSAQLQRQVMRDSSTYSPPNDNDDARSHNFTRPGICVPHTLSSEDLEDMRRCFRRANVRAEGYLDCKELKVYMDLRKCPITQWEADKILEYSDPTYSYYINLEQVLNLATYFGIGTPHPLRLTRSEFEISMKNAFRSESSFSDSDDFDFDGVVSYFESQQSKSDEMELSDQGNENDSIETKKISKTSGKEMGNQTIDYSQAREITNLAYPIKEKKQQKDETPEDEVYVDEEPLEPVKAIKQKWENKIQHLIATNGDDFLVKLSKHKKNALKVVGKENLPKNFQPPVKKFPAKVSTQTQFPSNSDIRKHLRPLPAPLVQSLYKRPQNYHKVAYEETQTKKNVKLRGVPPNKANINDWKNIPRPIAPPPLPAPILPELPKEWKTRPILKKH